jgi:hypothetical protein
VGNVAAATVPILSKFCVMGVVVEMGSAAHDSELRMSMDKKKPKMGWTLLTVPEFFRQPRETPLQGSVCIHSLATLRFRRTA